MEDLWNFQKIGRQKEMLFGWVLVVGVSLAIFLLMLGAEFWLGSVGAWNLGYSFRRSWCWLWLVGGGVWGHLFIVVLVFGCCLFIIGWGWIGIGCFCILINIISSKPFGLNLLYPRFRSLNLYLSIDWSYLKSSSSSEVVKRKKIPTPLRLFS